MPSRTVEREWDVDESEETIAARESAHMNTGGIGTTEP
jgi:hypothetical protein